MREQKRQEHITIIIVNYNGKKFLKKCMENIKCQTYKNISVLIVDNASTDGSVEYISREYPKADLLVCNENKGFASGNNLGIRYAVKQGAEYVLLLNADTEIDPNLIEKLRDEADENTVTVPQIFSDKRLMRVWYAGGEIDKVHGNSYHCTMAENTGIREVSFACGCCELIHKDIIANYGMFDEKYFMYFEDTDLSFRWAKHGVKVKYVPEAKMWHKTGGIRSKDGIRIKNYYMIRNRLYFINKYQKDMQKKLYQMALEFFIESVLKERDHDKRKYAWWAIMDFYAGKMSRFRH